MVAYTIGGVGTSINVDAVLQVAKGLEVYLDAAAAQRLKKAAPPPAQFKPDGLPKEATHAGSADDMLNPEEARAAILVRLSTLVAGSSGVRLAVIEALVGLLRERQAPQLPVCMHAEELQGQLAKILVSEAGPLSEGLSAQERAALEAGQSSAAGVAALQVGQGGSVLFTATIAAALTCEALGAQTRGFEDAAGEGQAYAASRKVASELRGMLEGSAQINARKGGAGAPACITCVPQVHGAAEAALSTATASVRAELALSAPPPDRLAFVAPAAQLAEDLLSLGRRVAGVAAQGLERVRLFEAAVAPGNSSPSVLGLLDGIEARLKEVRIRIGTCSQALDEGDGADPCLGVALAAADALASARGIAALECSMAMLSLWQQEQEGSGIGVVEDQPGKKEKKRGKGFALGKGTAIFFAFLKEAVGGLDQQLAGLELQQNGNGQACRPAVGGGAELDIHGAAAKAPGEIDDVYLGISAALDPLGAQLAPALGAVRGVLEANAARRKPKIAKGTRDFLPAQMAIRAHAFRIIERTFARHGAVAIDTPVFELRETLVGKYGEDSKLIYDLADQGGEALSLRYDLTVPFARYCALNGLGAIKRYHIGRVYRRDQPQAARGRFREFFQCDFDIAGAYPPMVPDAEVLKVTVEILEGLGLGDFRIKVNHRGLLDAMLRICGVPAQRTRAICSAIDKLDKEPWAAVRAEMVDQKGLAPEVADKIEDFVSEAGEPLAVLERLAAPGHALGGDPSAAAALAEMRTLFGLLGAMGGGTLARLSFDLSLARGLDYYTGLIYEAVFVRSSEAGEGDAADDNVGSIAAGGRYDGLVGIFSGKNVPAVGISIGIERVFAILERQLRRTAQRDGAIIRETKTMALVASPGKGMQAERIRLASELWAADVAAEFGYKANPNFKDSLQQADDAGTPFVLVLGESELKEGIVRVKNMWAKGTGDEKGDAVPRERIAAEMRARIDALGAEDALLSGKA